MCTWTESADSGAATVKEAAKTSNPISFKDGARVREIVVVNGGVLVVSTAGEVQLYDTAVQLLHSSGKPSGSTRVETVSALPESVGVLVVTTDGSKAHKRRVAVFLPNMRAEKSVEKLWEFEIEHPGGDSKAKVVSASSDGETFMILWDDRIWALHDAEDGVIKQQLNLEGMDVSSEESATGKRSKKSETTTSLSSAAALCLSKDYYAIAANSRDEQTVILAVLDSRYGAVHLAEDVSQGLEQKLGRTSGISLAAVSGSLVIGLSDQIVAVKFDLPELSLASLVGSLSVHAQPDASSAAVRVLGSQASSTSATAQHATVSATWNVDKSSLSGQGFVGLAPTGDTWNEEDTKQREKKIRAVSESLASGSKKAASSLEPLLSALPIPQVLIESAISGGLTHRAWQPVSMLLSEGHICGSSAAPALIPALLEEDMLDEVRQFLIHAIDVAPEDIKAVLIAHLDRDESEPGMKKRAKENRKAAEKAVSDAESVPRDDKQKRTECAARASLLVVAYDGFAPWAQELHALVARPLDPTVGATVLRSLSKEQCVSLLRYLLVWSKFYANSGGLFATVNTLSEAGIPNAHAVVSWASALLDAQLAMLCLANDTSELVGALKQSVEAMLNMMRPLATLRGALRHVTENSPLPEQHGVVSTTYTVESVAW